LLSSNDKKGNKFIHQSKLNKKKMSKPVISIKTRSANYAGLVNLGNRVFASMTGTQVHKPLHLLLLIFIQQSLL